MHLAASTQDSDGSVIRSLVLPTFGTMPPVAIEPSHIRAWVARLAGDGDSPSTVRRAHTLVQMALELAVKRDASPVHPVAASRFRRSSMRRSVSYRPPRWPTWPMPSGRGIESWF